MKVLVIKEFMDKKENTLRKLNEEFIASKARVEEINSTSFGVLVEEVKEEKKGAEDDKRRTKRTRKVSAKDND